VSGWVGIGAVPWLGMMDPWPPLSDIVGSGCRAWNRYFERGEVGATHAWATAEEEATVVEVVEHTVACCVAVTAAMAEEGPAATCAVVDTRALDFEHQEAFRPDPCPKVPCLEACRCSVDGDASDQVEAAYAAGALGRGPCCFGAETAGDKPAAASADLVVVVFGKSCHTDYWAWRQMWRQHVVTAPLVRPGVLDRHQRFLAYWPAQVAHVGVSRYSPHTPCGSCVSGQAAC
jgi:hypothetical protein